MATTAPSGTRAASIQRRDCPITMKSKLCFPDAPLVYLWSANWRGGRQKVKSSENVDTKEQCVSMCCYRQLPLPIEFHLSPSFFLLFSLRIIVSLPVTMFPSRHHRWTGPQPLTSWRPPVTPAFLLLRSKNHRRNDVDPSELFGEQQDASWESSPGSCTYHSERQCQLLHTRPLKSLPLPLSHR